LTETDPEAGVLAALDRLGIAYRRLDCDPEAADTAAFCARYGYPPANSANTIVVASKKEPRRYAACVVRASTVLDVNHVVKRLMGVSRLSFASPEETTRLTGMLVGGVTPFGLPPDLPVYVDAGLMGLDYVILGGGGRSSKLRIEPADLRKVPNVSVIPGLALERGPEAAPTG
jgi:prolyl-tRNA editing enzyme YbaK/EbsC (Cys-tRNA(Pro) deacylase)